MEQATRDLNGFLNENEEANANLDVLSEMLQAQPALTLHGAYTQMIRWAHEHGLDWTQPLKPQLATQGQQPTHQQPTQQPTRPLPARGARGNGAQPVEQREQWAIVQRKRIVGRHHSVRDARDGVQLN